MTRDVEGDLIALRDRVKGLELLSRSLLTGLDDIRNRLIELSPKLDVMFQAMSHLGAQSQATAEMVCEIHCEVFEDGAGEGEMVN